jgi:type 1 glutamine amidotransferase
MADDELYHNMRMQADVKILATAYDDPATGGTGKEEPILWVVNYGKGRVFHTTLGHDPAAIAQPAFMLPFLRGAEWAASGRVGAGSGLTSGDTPSANSRTSH